MHGTLPDKQRMTVWRAKQIAGTLSFPSKMPSTSYDLPATACILGAKLAKIEGTACSSCYALHGGGRYSMANAQKGMHYRLRSLGHPQWVEAMVFLLKRTHSKSAIRVDLGLVGVRLQRHGGSRFKWATPGFHRWHGSGDLQSIEHFANICEVARQTPKIAHWLPTQELGFVRRYVTSDGVIPCNLAVRVSSIMVDDPAPRRSWPLTSEVFAENIPAGAHICPAPHQGRVCGSCRACWSADVPHVGYAQH